MLKAIAGVALMGSLVGVPAAVGAADLGNGVHGSAVCIAAVWENPVWVTADGVHLARTERYCDGTAQTNYRRTDGRSFSIWTLPGQSVELEEDGSGVIRYNGVDPYGVQIADHGLAVDIVGGDGATYAVFDGGDGYRTRGGVTYWQD